MKSTFNIQRLLMLLRELYDEKCNEVKWLISSKKYSLKIIEKRQQEADKLKEALELTKVNPNALIRLQTYVKLDDYLTVYTKSHPDLLGHNIIFGPDKPELFGYYSRIPWNVPISFFKN